MQTEQYGSKQRSSISPTVACIEGDHERCSGEHPRVGSYTGPMPKCPCACHVEPWPFPCAESPVTADGDIEP